MPLKAIRWRLEVLWQWPAEGEKEREKKGGEDEGQESGTVDKLLNLFPVHQQQRLTMSEREKK